MNPLKLLPLLVAFAAQAQRAPIADYIHTSWPTLTRSMSECKSVVDSKVLTPPILYLPANLPTPSAVTAMQKQCKVEVEHLPHPITHIGPVKLAKEGLLYLPNPYVVPGGRFNEMYGWDSYFILLGLIDDHRVPLAKGIVENFFFEIENYGAILNANRTYFFTRSQPPLLSSMISEVYGQTHDTQWLAHAYQMAVRDHALWTSPLHNDPATGLAHYADLGAGPVPEMSDDNTYYPDVIRWLLAHPADHPEYLTTDAAQSCDPTISKLCAEDVVEGHHLTAAFYRGDRAMRESGFDTTFRFGPFSGSTDQYLPICLNSLLYKYERDLAAFATALRKPKEADRWNKAAEARKAAINQYLWDAKAGLFTDYNTATARQSTYHYVTTFYPLWAGLATPSQAASIASHLSLFEHDGGLAMSDIDSGTQWDLPYGWAPTNFFAIDGLARYGFRPDASRLAGKFLQTVTTNYQHDGTIREKYNMVSGTANVAVAAGYKENVIGFGWTNGVYRRLRALVP